MPAKPAWFQALTTILETVRTFPFPILDRSAVEALFQVRRRRAQQLLKDFGGFQSGRLWLIERKELVCALEAIQRGDSVVREARRRAKFQEALGEIHRMHKARRITIPTDGPVCDTVLDGLPPSVELARGILRITFNDAEDLLRQLYILSQTLANDFNNVERLLRSTSKHTDVHTLVHTSL